MDEKPFVLLRETDKYKMYSRAIELDTTHVNKDYAYALMRYEHIYVFDDIVVQETRARMHKETYRLGENRVNEYYTRLSSTVYSCRRRTKEGNPMFRVMSGCDLTSDDPRHNPKSAHDAEVARYVVEMYERVYGETVPKDILQDSMLYSYLAYPLLREWDLADGKDKIRGKLNFGDHRSFKKIAKHFMQRDVRSFVKSAFGARFVTDEFIEVVGTCRSLNRLSILSQYREYFTAESGISFLSYPWGLGVDNTTYFFEKKIVKLITAGHPKDAVARLLMSKDGYINYSELGVKIYHLRRNGDELLASSKIDITNWKTVELGITLLSNQQAKLAKMQRMAHAA